MKIKTIVVLLFFAVTIIGIMAPINATESLVSSEDKIYSIESKKKAASLKITWNANGGKIGSKITTLTTVKKGSALNKLAATPKRSGYTFNGWYTQKTGGKKITKNTIPAKSVTYFARWSKQPSLTSEEKKLVGLWRNKFIPSDATMSYAFRADGTFLFTESQTWLVYGKYKVSGGKITFSNIECKWGGKKYDYTKTVVAEYRFEKNPPKSDLLNIVGLGYPEKNYLPLSFAWDRYWKYG